MNALTTSLEEVGKPIEIDSIIRILKAQYDKKKSLSTNQEEQGFMGSSTKKTHTCTNCKRTGHPFEDCWAKGGGKEGLGPKQIRDPGIEKRKRKKKRMQPKKAPATEKLMNQL